MCVRLNAYVCTMCVLGAYGSQKEALDPWNWRYKGCEPTLGTPPGYSGGAASALNHLSSPKATWLVSWFLVFVFLFVFWVLVQT